MHNIKMIELKFRKKGQLTEWENIPVAMTVPADKRDKLISLAIISLKRRYQMEEIRWNYKNSCQGHYVKGNTV